jgi:hypothetical protein
MTEAIHFTVGDLQVCRHSHNKNNNNMQRTLAFGHHPYVVQKNLDIRLRLFQKAMNAESAAGRAPRALPSIGTNHDPAATIETGTTDAVSPSRQRTLIDTFRVKTIPLLPCFRTLWPTPRGSLTRSASPITASGGG